MKLKLYAALATAILGCMSASPSIAACLAGPYAALPPVTINLSSKILPYTDMTGQTLPAGSKIVSQNGVYELRVRYEGDIALFKNGTQKIWSSPVQNCLPTPYAMDWLRLQSDGNMVVYYHLQNNPVQPVAAWSTGTSGHSFAQLWLTDTGALYIVGNGGVVVWSR